MDSFSSRRRCFVYFMKCVFSRMYMYVSVCVCMRAWYFRSFGSDKPGETTIIFAWAFCTYSKAATDIHRNICTRLQFIWNTFNWRFLHSLPFFCQNQINKYSFRYYLNIQIASLRVSITFWNFSFALKLKLLSRDLKYRQKPLGVSSFVITWIRFLTLWWDICCRKNSISELIYLRA